MRASTVTAMPNRTEKADVKKLPNKKERKKQFRQRMLKPISPFPEELKAWKFLNKPITNGRMQ